MTATEISIGSTQFTLCIRGFTTLYVTTGTYKNFRGIYIHSFYCVAGNTVFDIKVEILRPEENHIMNPMVSQDFSKKKRVWADNSANPFQNMNAIKKI